MKRTIKILSFLLALVFALSMFVACETTDDSSEKVTVQWVQGQKVLKEEQVEKGSKITPWTPNFDGMEFDGWYERPYIKRFDFTKPITQSVRIYGKFKFTDDSFTEEFEMPDYYLIGAGKGDLSKANNWNHTDAAKNLGLVAGDDGIYRITLSLYAGDQFKMDNDLSWDSGAWDCSAFEGYDNGVVRNSSGVEVFRSGENGNIVVAAGQNGQYEISYNPETDKIGFNFIKELDPIPDDIRLNGDFRGSSWPTTYTEDEYKFVSEDGNIWTYEWEVTSTAKFKIYNKSSGVWYPGGTDNDLSIEPGKYTVEFNLATGNIKVTDENGNEVDVGFNNSGNQGGDQPSVTPNANPVDKVYMVLNSEWNDGSLIGAWVWAQGMDGQMVVATPTDDANVFEVAIPTGANLIVFFDLKAGETDLGNEWANRRAQSDDLAIPDKSDDKIYYHVGVGAWSNDTTPPEDVGAPTVDTPIYFVPNTNWLADDARFAVYYWNSSSNGWVDLVAVEGQEGVYTATIPASYGNVIFCRMNPSYENNGWNNETETDHVWNQSENLTIQEGDAKYFVMYSDAWDGNNNTTPTGSWKTDATVPEGPVNPGTPTEGTVVYLVPSAYWNQSGARFAVYYWDGNGHDGWVSMTLVDDNLYMAVVPAGNSNVIFCRMNPTDSNNSWNTKWNQTSDLMLGSGNCYTVAEGTWDKGGGSWSTYVAGSCVHTPAGEGTVLTAPTCTEAGEGSYVCSKCNETYTASIPATGHSYGKDGKCTGCGLGSVYTVAGTGNLCGNEWTPEDTNNDMEFVGDGVYQKVYTDLAVGEYKFKVVQDHSWSVNWGDGGPNAGDFVVNITTSGSTLTITFDGTTVTYEIT